MWPESGVGGRGVLWTHLQWLGAPVLTELSGGPVAFQQACLSLDNGVPLSPSPLLFFLQGGGSTADLWATYPLPSGLG